MLVPDVRLSSRKSPFRVRTNDQRTVSSSKIPGAWYTITPLTLSADAEARAIARRTSAAVATLGLVPGRVDVTTSTARATTAAATRPRAHRLRRNAGRGAGREACRGRRG